MSTLRRWIFLALIGCALAACNGGDEPEDAAPAASLAVTLAPAQVRELERAVAVSGPIVPWELMELGVQASGLRVTGVYVDVGEFVERGQLLVELDARTLDVELRQVRAAFEEAQAGLQLAESNLRRAEGLVRDQYISAGQVDELRAARAQAQARVATARASLDAAQLRRDFAELRAPDDGIIAERSVEPGQVVSAGTPLLSLIREGRLEWRPELADAELAAVSVGDPAVVQAPGGSEVEGEVRAVSPGVSTSTRTGTVYVALDDPQTLQVGSYVPGRILVGEARALTVPVEAVVRRDGNAYVFTVGDDGLARRLRVRTGSEARGLVEILDGLKSGTPVVVEGAGFVGDGDPVRVVPAGTGAAPAAPR